jgi:hypothetical protein
VSQNKVVLKPACGTPFWNGGHITEILVINVVSDHSVWSASLMYKKSSMSCVSGAGVVL